MGPMVPGKLSCFFNWAHAPRPFVNATDYWTIIGKMHKCVPKHNISLVLTNFTDLTTGKRSDVFSDFGALEAERWYREINHELKELLCTLSNSNMHVELTVTLTK
jgi:hypothetical protein